MTAINRACMVNRQALSRQALEMAEKNLREVMRKFDATDPDSVERYRAAVEREEIARAWYLLELGD